MSPLHMPDEMTTERLTLRPYSFSDVDGVFEMASDDEWAHFLPMPRPYLRVHAEQFIAKQVLLDRSAHCSWAILHGGAFVGGINIRHSPQDSLAELGYSIRRERWGQGLATEAVSVIVEHAFQGNASLNRLRAMTDAKNTASLRVLAKCRFVREGRLRQNRFVAGKPIDEVWFGILRSEWEAR